ncbi:MAG: hypothetical protein AAB197_05200 [Deltaproteobacteria bacterium]
MITREVWAADSVYRTGAPKRDLKNKSAPFTAVIDQFDEPQQPLLALASSLPLNGEWLNMAFTQ